MEGSKGLAPGVTKALRFWEIVSSVAPRDTRRKSIVLGDERELGASRCRRGMHTSEGGGVKA
jgi:hypothetical protein